MFKNKAELLDMLNNWDECSVWYAVECAKFSPDGRNIKVETLSVVDDANLVQEMTCNLASHTQGVYYSDARFYRCAQIDNRDAYDYLMHLNFE